MWVERDLPAQVVVHGGFQDQRHIGDGAGVGFIVKAHAVGEVSGVREAQLLQLVVHHVHKGLVGAAQVVRKAQGGIGAGGRIVP